MAEQSTSLNVTTQAGVTVVELTDRKILDEINITQIGEHLNALVVGVDKPKLVMDFGSVSHMSSSALGMLITLNKRVRKSSGELKLCNIQPAIYVVFVITRLNEIFDIYQSRDKAIESLS